MKAALLALALVSGCASHPFASTALVNTSIVVGAGVCTIECSGGARGFSEAVLIGELSLSSLAAAFAIQAIFSYEAR